MRGDRHVVRPGRGGRLRQRRRQQRGDTQAGSAAQSTPVTADQLEAALLAPADLPGFKVDTSAEGEDDTLKVASADAACKTMVKLSDELDAGTSRDQVADADVSLAEEGQQGSSVDHGLIAFKAGAAQKPYTDYVTAAKACKSFTFDLGSGLLMKLKQVPAPAFSAGDEATLVRFTGDVQGRAFQLDQVVVRVGDVLTGVDALHGGKDPELASQAAQKAVDKLKQATAS